MDMNFEYYYGNQAEQFSFIKIPKIMITDEIFSDLSLPAKVLYGLLLDRMSLSMKNRWFDSENRVYIIYQIADIQEDLGISKNKAIDLLAALEKFGLVEKKRRGLGMPSLLYVKNFITEQHGSEKVPFTDKKKRNPTSRSPETATSGSAQNSTSRSVERKPQEVVKITPQEVAETTPPISKTNNNHTDCNKSISNPIISQDGMGLDAEYTRSYEQYEEFIRQNIEYDLLVTSHENQKEILQELLALIMEVIMCKSEEMVIAKNIYPTEIVRSRFLKLNYSHIQYVLLCLQKNTTKVKNIKKYMLATLFNAPCTIEGYYQAEVNHDFPQYVR